MVRGVMLQPSWSPSVSSCNYWRLWPTIPNMCLINTSLLVLGEYLGMCMPGADLRASTTQRPPPEGRQWPSGVCLVATEPVER
eukprot:scaffold174948_cov36-Prasinocladus_malaysianus.AAC.1